MVQEANRMSDKVCVEINQAYQQINDYNNYVTVEKAHNTYWRLGMNHETLLTVFRSTQRGL
ncbi:hypothetical protein [Coprobacter sp.]|uniref:hypothetical protein n=1 Tax=Coprobacter sp. TaxID=1941478 RepID=UPI003AB6A1B4